MFALVLSVRRSHDDDDVISSFRVFERIARTLARARAPTCTRMYMCACTGFLNDFYLSPLGPTQTGERSIFERGCLRAGEEWLELNMVPVAGAAVSTMVLQVLYSSENCRAPSWEA